MLHLHQTLSGHQNPIYALAESAKPGIIFSGGNDKGVVEWSLKRMEFIMVKWPVNTSVYCLLSYKNELFAGERSGRITSFDFTEQRVKHSFKAHSKAVFDIKIIDDKKEMLSAGEDGDIAVWSLEKKEEIFRFQVTPTTIRKLSISPDQHTLVAATKDNYIHIYSTADYILKQSVEAHTPSVTSLAFHPQNNYLITGGRDAQLRIWDPVTFSQMHQIPAHMMTVYKIAFHPVLPYIATCSQDKSIKIWGSENFKLYKILSTEKTGFGHKHSVNDLMWTADGKFLISTGDDRQIMVWAFDE